MVVMRVTDALSEAERAYRSGGFPEAERAYRAALEADPDSVRALAGAGAVALLSNRLDAAKRLLESVASAGGEADPGAWVLQDLMEAAYRQDDFAGAASWLRRLAERADARRREQLRPVVRKLEAFAGVRPYRVTGDRGGGDRGDVRVPFEVTDPLPVVEVGFADGSTEPFFIDTGGHEVYLDRGLARRLGLPGYGTTRITGAGGKQGEEGHARLGVMALGGLRVHDLPVRTLDFDALGFTEALGGVPVKGAIGTAFLYHFLSTIDYTGGALILRPRTAERLRLFERQAADEHQQIVPFWLAGTHYILAKGTIHDSEPMLFFVDTGGAGVGFVGTRSTVERAGIRLRHEKATSGAGAGGTAQIVPFAVDRLTLGDVAGRNLAGIYFPESDLADALRQNELSHLDFPIGGIVSHEFFRGRSLTIDFVGMRLFVGAEASSGNGQRVGKRTDGE